MLRPIFEMTKKSERTRRRALLKKRFHLLMILLILYLKKTQRHRLGNQIRDRANPLSVIREKTDLWFHKSYRIPREVLYEILSLISPHLETLNAHMDCVSSGHHYMQKYCLLER